MEQTNAFSNLYQVAEIELIYKSRVKASQRPQISSSSDAYNILLQVWEEGKIDFVEQFKVLLLNRANKVIGVVNVSTGGDTGTVADPKLIFTAALKANACSLIASHNHPSGNLKPSRADEQLTQKIKQAGEFLDIKLLDHLIISSEGFYSFADEGLL
ncbi:MAG TPA: JAB domain-containing protein [Flavisolibacter sp.]|nr:JAB domain-containing protein [Flavisolibacter sp.]